MPPTRRVSRRLLLGLLGAGAAGALAGCGSASPPSPPTGVDLIEVPTPSPDPSDYVAEVDNPWWPLPRGTTRSYRIRGGLGHTRLVEVDPDPGEVAGVATTVVHTRDLVGRGARRRSIEVASDHYAQDEDGHVWWLAREGAWRAGVDGALAGLAMPAEPRLGDGWRMALLPGVVEDHAEVVEKGEDDLVLVVTDPITGAVRHRAYQRGTGLVLDEQLAPGTVGGPEALELLGPT